MTYTPRLPLRKHQVDALVKTRTQPTAFANLSEMGCGKTAVTLTEFGERVEASDLADLLVVAPAGSYRNWWFDGPGVVSELTKHLSPALRERLLVCGYRSGMGLGAKAELEWFLRQRDRPRAMFINVEALSLPGRAREAATEFLAAGRAMMVIDESTRVRSPDSKRTDFIVRAGWAAHARRIMTGLPAPRSPMDLFSQFEFLNKKILRQGSFFTFRMRYAVMKKIPVGVKVTKSGERKTRWAWVDIAYRNEEELAALIEPYSFRVLKKDCLDLPPKVYLPERHVEMTDEQRRVYTDLVSQATAELDGGGYVSADRRITQVMRLRQVCGGFVGVEGGGVQALKSRRVEALLEVLEEQVGKVVVWCSFVPELLAVAAALRQEYGPAAVALFYGGNVATRHEDEARWKGDAACRFMVSTQSAGGVGNNWTMGNLSVYFSNTYDLEHRAQSEDRTHRDGLVGTATYLDLVCHGTVEDKILDALRRKIDVSSALMGDGYREWLR